MNQYKGAAPILLVIVAIICGYFFTYPQWTELGDHNLQLEQAQKQNDALKQSEAEMDNFLKQYRTFGTQALEANKVLPLKKSEMQNIVANIGRFAASSGLSLSGATIEEPDASKYNENSIAYADLTVSSSGTYPSYRAFLQQLENSLRIFDVYQVNLTTSQEEGSSSDILQIQMIVRIYYQK